MGALDKKRSDILKLMNCRVSGNADFPSSADLQTRAMAYLGATAPLN
jgi:hypothetical protein